MNLRLTVIAAALSVLAVGSAYAEGGCDYGSKYRYTSAEPQETPATAADKLASLDAPATSESGETATPAPAQPATAQ